MIHAQPAIAAPNAACRRSLLLALVLAALGWAWLAATLAPAPAAPAGHLLQPVFAAHSEPPPDFDSADPVSLRRLAEQPPHPDLAPPAPLPAALRPALAEARLALPAVGVRATAHRRGGEARAPPVFPSAGAPSPAI